MIDYRNDQYTTQIDDLGFDEFALQALELIVGAETPFALALSGRWGSGKTSMLRTLMHVLKGKPLRSVGNNYFHEEVLPGKLCEALEAWQEGHHEILPNREERDDIPGKVQCVWFNPWQYQHEPHPVIPLLHEIRLQLRGEKKRLDENWSKAEAARDAAFHSLGALTDSLVNMFAGKRLFNVGETASKAYKEVLDKREAEHFDAPTDAQRFFLQFESAIRMLVNPADGQDEQARLVIFIDDLDRCAHAVTFALLESIKLYLSSKHCVFVFGLDRVQVEQAVAEAGKFTPPEAAQYVEKLFQLKLYLPQPGEEKLKKFIFDRLKPFGFPRALTAKLAAWLPPNPRGIKNFLNGLLLHGKLAAGPKRGLEFHHRLALIHLLRFYYPDAYELLLQSPEAVWSNLLTVMRGSPDLANEQHAYLHHVLENPLMVSAKSGLEEEKPGDDKKSAAPMSGERFRLIRAGAWKAGATQAFFADFVKEFENAILADMLRIYLR